MDWWCYELALVILILVCGLYIWGTWHNDTFKKRGVPYMKPTPFLGTMAPFWFGRVSLGEHSLKTYNAFKGKSLVGFFDFRQPSIMIRDPDLIKMVMTKDFDHFVDHRNSFFDEKDEPLFGNGLFVLKGSRWRSIRNLLTPAFTSNKMKAMFTLVAECGKQLGEHLEERCAAEGGKSLTLDMTDLLTRYANDVIATSAFGIHCNSLREPNDQLYLTGKEALDLSGPKMLRILRHMLAPSLMKMLNIHVTLSRVNDFFLNLVRDTIRTREREGTVRPDLIHLLMQARKRTLQGNVDDAGKEETGNKGISLSDDDIAAQAFDFYNAGFDTTSSLYCFLSHLLAVHPDIQLCVQQEIDAVLQEDGGKLTYEGLVQKMKYLDMVINEALRLWPPSLDTDRYVSPTCSSQKVL